MEQAVVLVSGGIDSTVLLHYLSKQGYTLYALACQYGQRHCRELICAERQSELARAKAFTSVPMLFMADLIQSGSALIKTGSAVPDLVDIPESMRDQPPTYVPNRNMVFLSIAAAYAESLGIEQVFYGAQSQDEYGYWDCTQAFLEGINALLSLNRRRPVRVEAPLLHNSKTDNVKLGIKLGVDFSMTWSCYRGEEEACGTCPTCVERLKAFQGADIPDSIPYRVVR